MDILTEGNLKRKLKPDEELFVEVICKLNVKQVGIGIPTKLGHKKKYKLWMYLQRRFYRFYVNKRTVEV
jgi:hypothetical protein